MLTLVITVVLGLGFAIFATQNTEAVSLNFGQYILPNVPIYLVVLFPLIIGLFASLFVQLIKDLSSSLTMNEQKDEIKKLREDNAKLTKQVHELELENTKFKSENGSGDFDEESI